MTTKGGPANASNVLQLYIYGKAFGRFEFGYASAMSVALFVVLIVITFLQYRLTRAGAADSDTNEWSHRHGRRGHHGDAAPARPAPGSRSDAPSPGP